MAHLRCRYESKPRWRAAIRERRPVTVLFIFFVWIGPAMCAPWSRDLVRCFVKERNLKLDNAKGILITLVVIGHMLLPIQGTTRGVTNFFYMIYTFHMPAFVFISGLLAQRIYTRVPKGRFNLRRWCSTLWLYLLFQFILFFSEIPAYGRTTRFPDFLHTSGAPWYLLALLLWYLMIPFFYAYRNFPYSLIAWILLTIMSLAGGYLASGTLAGLGDFLALDRVIAFAPFFFAGYFIVPERLMRFLGAEQERTLSKNQTGRKDISAAKRATSRRRSPEEAPKRAGRGIVLLLSALGLLCFALVGTQTFDHLLPYKNVVYGAWYYRFHSEQNPAAFPGALAAQLWLIRLAWFLVSGLMSFALLALMPNRRLPLLTTIGQRTLQIYILHRPIRDLLLAGGFITAAGPENSAHVLLLIALSILLTIVLSAGILQRLFNAIQKLPERLLL